MAEFDWAATLAAAAASQTSKAQGQEVYVAEGLYVTDSSDWGFHGYYPEADNYATVFDASSAYETPIPQEDGSDANETIDELSNLQALVATGARRPNNQGVFICGQKYTLMRAVMSGDPRDVEELRSVENFTEDDAKVVFNKVFMLAAGEHQVLVAEDKQTYVYIVYANKKNCELEKCHETLMKVAAYAAYFAGSAE